MRFLRGSSPHTDKRNADMQTICLCCRWLCHKFSLTLFCFQMYNVRHNNLLTFLGACIETGNIAVLSEVCPRGSLMVSFNP